MFMALPWCRDRLTPNPAFDKEDRPFDGPEPSRYMCPVTLQELNGSHSFAVLKSTGWVMSEKAIKEVGIDSLQVWSCWCWFVWGVGVGVGVVLCSYGIISFLTRVDLS